MHRRLVVLTLLATGCAEVAREDEAPDDYGATEQGLRACPGAATLQGIDVSGYQPNTNWAQVAGAGKKFAIIKATEATGYTNPYFARDWAQAKANGVIRGAYHFFRPSYDGVAQADHFVNVMGALGDGDLPGMLDLEVTDGQSASTIVARMKAFLLRVEQRTGKRPLIYVGYYFWRDTLGNPQGYASYPLVIAAYVSPCPLIPDQWAKFTMWQYTSSGNVAGVTTRVDLDVFNGSQADLDALVGLGGTRVKDLASLAGGKSGYLLLGNGTLKPFGGAPALATGLSISAGGARSVALRADGKSGYVLDSRGAVHAFGGAVAATGAPTFGADLARSLALRTDGRSGYVLDAAGGLHPWGGAVAATGGPSWAGQDLARDVVLRADGKSGYVLDAWGGVHPFGGAPAVTGLQGYTTGQDVARALVLGFDQKSGFVLHKTGTVYGFGGAPTPATHPAWAGDAARALVLEPDGISGVAVDEAGDVKAFSADPVKDLALTDSGAGYVLYGSGALKPVGGAAAVTNGPSWPAADIARRVTLRLDGKGGYVLDAAGALHPIGNAPAATGGAYWAGKDLARAFALRSDGTGGYLLDAWGGLHSVSGAAALPPGPYWSGKDFARDLALRTDGSGYVLDAEGGLHPLGSAPALEGVAAFPGLDVARRVLLRDDGTSGWVLDAWGAVHAFGGAPSVVGGVWWPGFDAAKGLAMGGDGRLRLVDAYGRLTALSLVPMLLPAEELEGTLEPLTPEQAGLPPAELIPGEGGPADGNNPVVASCAAVPGLGPLATLLLLAALRRQR